jgi:hypothetical protein
MTQVDFARRNSSISIEWTWVAMFAACILAATPAIAQSDDAAYCEKLYDYAMRYAGNAGGEGRAVPDIGVMLAIENCRKGNYAPGIKALEDKIRSKGFSLPKR